MTILTFSQLEQTWLTAAQGTKYESSQWANLMAAIALAESSGNSDATNPTDNGGTQTSWGLWQISLGNHNEPSPDWSNPVTNAQLAIGKLNSQGLSAWGTYDSGAYKQFLNGAIPDPGQLQSTGSGRSSATLTSIPGDIFQGILGEIFPGLGGVQEVQGLLNPNNWIDWLERGALMLFGAVLIIIGLWRLTEGSTIIKEEDDDKNEEAGQAAQAAQASAEAPAAEEAAEVAAVA